MKTIYMCSKCGKEFDREPEARKHEEVDCKVVTSRTGDRDRDEAEEILKRILSPLSPRKGLLADESQPDYSDSVAAQMEWEERVQLFIWHLLEAAGRAGRGVVR